MIFRIQFYDCACDVPLMTVVVSVFFPKDEYLGVLKSIATTSWVGVSEGG